MVPDPMISTPFSAWILRIENMRSCLRIVDAPSIPSSSDIATRSAGVFFFSSFKCIGIVFSWGVGARARQSGSKAAKAAGRREAMRKRSAGLGEQAGAAWIRGMSGPARCQRQRGRHSLNRLEGPDDHEDDD